MIVFAHGLFVCFFFIYSDTIADQNREKFNLHLSQWRVVLYAMSRLTSWPKIHDGGLIEIGKALSLICTNLSELQPIPELLKE